MNINLPSKVRGAIYVAIFIGNPVMFYLGQQGRLDVFYVGLWTVIVSAVAALARINLSE